MHGFHYRGNKLYCEGMAIDSLAKKYGTPLYVYSQGTLTDHFQKLDRALAPLDHLVCYAMKSNSNLAILRVLAILANAFLPASARRRRKSPLRSGKAFIPSTRKVNPSCSASTASPRA